MKYRDAAGLMQAAHELQMAHELTRDEFGLEGKSLGESAWQPIDVTGMLHDYHVTTVQGWPWPDASVFVIAVEIHPWGLEDFGSQVY